MRYILQQSLLEQEMDHDDVHEDTWQEKENQWKPFLKRMFCQPCFVTLDIQKIRKS